MGRLRPFVLHMTRAIPARDKNHRGGADPGEVARVVDRATAANAGIGDGPILLPTLDVAAALGPILHVQSAYRLIASLAVQRGFDPDHPAHLRKVTETV